jgi:hypothetical protein
LPQAGRLLRWLQQPVNLGIVLAGIIAFPFVGDGARRHSTRRRGRQMANEHSDHADSSNGDGRRLAPHAEAPQPDPSSATSAVAAAFGVAALVAVLSGALLIYGAFQPLEREHAVERLRYEHSAAFNYTVHTAPATLYPGQVVRPVAGAAGTQSASASTAGKATAPPESRPEQAIYTQLAQRIVVDFTYELKSTRPSDGLRGELSALLEVRAGTNGWRRTQQLLAPTAFDAGATTAQLDIGLAPLNEMIAAIEKETGSKSRTYELIVTPTVRISGNIGGEQINEVYAPAYLFNIEEQQIIPAPQLTYNRERVLQTQVTEPVRIAVAGRAIALGKLHSAAVLVVVPATLIATCLGAVLFFGMGRNAAAQIQARYGSMLLPIDPGRGSDTRRRVRVSAFRDLVRLARRDEPAVIFHEYADGWHRYSVEDSATVYEYDVRGDSNRGGLREFLTTGRP